MQSLGVLSLQMRLILEEIVDILENNDEILLMQDSMERMEHFASSLDAEKENAIFILRIRRDNSVKNGIQFCSTADALRKVSSLNAVQIAEKYFKID